MFSRGQNNLALYSDHTLEEIRSRMNLVELVGEYVSLKKSGLGYVGLCPFHNEKSPSFHVHPVKQYFHCFGCQKGGNIFTFLSGLEGLSFPESVQRLAKRTGVELKTEVVPRKEIDQKAQFERERLLAVHEWAAKYFHFLFTQGKEYEFARDYLKTRGINEKTIQKFRIGVSPIGWGTLMGLMLKRGFTMGELVRAGLVIEKENSPTQGYDRFRQRLMFPICDREGNTIGFGARLLQAEENQPKYLNSPESSLFSKRNTLYGLSENGRGIRLKGEAVIVEGYMDVVGLYQAGVDNAVATMGTALTEEHCRLLRAVTRRAVTVFDPDAAGVEASKRSIPFFLSAGIFAKDLSLPEGKDPDEYVLANGAETFYQLCEKAPRQITKMLKEIASLGALSEERRTKILEDLTPILVVSRRLADRAALWDDISMVLGVSLDALRELSHGERTASRTLESDRPRPPTRTWRDPRPLAPMIKSKHDPFDIGFLKLCIQCPEDFQKIPAALWANGLAGAKIRHWLESLHPCVEPEAWQNKLGELMQSETDPELLAIASAGFFANVAESQPDKEGPTMLLLLAERLQGRQKEREIRALSAQVKLSQRLGNDSELIELLGRLKELRTS